MDDPQNVVAKEPETLEEAPAEKKSVADKKKIAIHIRKLDRLETTTARPDNLADQIGA